MRVQRRGQRPPCSPTASPRALAAARTLHPAGAADTPLPTLVRHLQQTRGSGTERAPRRARSTLTTSRKPLCPPPGTPAGAGRGAPHLHTAGRPAPRARARPAPGAQHRPPRSQRPRHQPGDKGSAGPAAHGTHRPHGVRNQRGHEHGHRVSLENV